MWLVLDIGNTAAKGGFFEGSALRRTFRLSARPNASSRHWYKKLREVTDGQPITRIGIASVVPKATAAAEAALRQLTNRPVEVIHPALRLPFRFAYETPATLGTDRLAAAVAAWMHYRPDPPRPVVAVDAGTAVTYEVVDAAGTYLGGAIGAGPRLLGHALRKGTAQLPNTSVELPPRCIGRSTTEALQSGILYGFLDAVRGMLHRLHTELGEQPVIVLTGGWSPLLRRHLDAVDHVEPHLVLHGIRLLLELNEGTEE